MRIFEDSRSTVPSSRYYIAIVQLHCHARFMSFLKDDVFNKNIGLPQSEDVD